MLKTILNYHDQLNWVQFLTNTKEDKDMTDRIGVVYAENDTKLLWLIRSSANCDKNEIGQLYDWLYICGLHKKWNWVVMTDQIESNLGRKTN